MVILIVIFLSKSIGYVN